MLACLCSYVEILALGVRDMAPFQFLPINMPFLEFDCGDRARSADVKMTKASKVPSGQNANFLEVRLSAGGLMLNLYWEGGFCGRVVAHPASCQACKESLVCTFTDCYCKRHTTWWFAETCHW